MESTEDGTVLLAGRLVDYATAYDWAVENLERSADLVEVTKVFVTVMAESDPLSSSRLRCAKRSARAGPSARATWSG